MASTSKYRRALLTRLAVPFSCAVPGVDETAEPGERALQLVTRLAKAKASAVGAAHPAAWVIGSDQAAVRVDAADGEIVLGKPGTAAACIEQLRGCSGQTVTFITAVALLRQADQSLIEFNDSTRVLFRPLDSGTIARYVEREQPFDCAGGFKSEALGITLCESISSSDPSALIGMPLIRLAAALRTAGYPVP